MNSVDDFLYRQEVVKPLVLDLLENGLVHVHNEHEPGKKPHNNFFMAKTTVSQALWVAFMRDNPSVYSKEGEDMKKFPVDDVFLDDCRVFVRNLNEHPEVKKARLVFRIPRKAEWLFACRAGGETYLTGSDACQARGSSLCDEAWFLYTPHPYTPDTPASSDNVGRPAILSVGANMSSKDILTKIAKDEEEKRKGPRPMGLLKDNGRGLYDMYGNLWEWTCEGSDDKGLLFGGSWNDGPEACTWTPRDGFPKRGDGITGLRLVATRARGRKPNGISGA